MPSVLPFTLRTADGDAVEFRFPLHRHTQSPERVGDLLAAILDTITADIVRRGDTGNGDVLQAVAMALAVRGWSTPVDPAVAAGLAQELVAAAFAAIGAAPRGEAQDGAATAGTEDARPGGDF